MGDPAFSQIGTLGCTLWLISQQRVPLTPLRTWRVPSRRSGAAAWASTAERHTTPLALTGSSGDVAIALEVGWKVESGQEARPRAALEHESPLVATSHLESREAAGRKPTALVMAGRRVREPW